MQIANRETGVPGQHRPPFQGSFSGNLTNQFDGAAAVKKLMLTVAKSEEGNLH
jgi:hypothetical protein